MTHPPTTITTPAPPAAAGEENSAHSDSAFLLRIAVRV
jgi:hypothetical protein